MPLEFSEQPDTGLVAVTLTDADGTVLQTRVVAAEEISRIAARARAAVERSERTGEPGLYVTLDELIDGS
ncbi:hypothetical protein [Actinomycetospora chlora]|uniref:hypothetical protein n=1 Tax=Actinomycetospora chlora TaxID=663608 RepID=UPI0031ED5E04